MLRSLGFGLVFTVAAVGVFALMGKELYEFWQSVPLTYGIFAWAFMLIVLIADSGADGCSVLLAGLLISVLGALLCALCLIGALFVLNGELVATPFMWAIYTWCGWLISLAIRASY